MGAFDEFLSVQKLYSDVYFSEINRYNNNQQSSWVSDYPHHSKWSIKAHKDLKSGERIAYGIFKLNGKTETNELFGSVMIKKSIYTPELELKNLIIFEDKLKDLQVPEKELEELRSLLATKLLLKVIAYAGYRGFKRITSEISQKHPILKQFIDSKFTINGTKAPKYFESDEILYLNFEVDFTYGLDPYDSFSASKWILEKNLDAKKFDNKNKDVKINGKASNAECYSFYNGKEYEDKMKAKFNFQNHVFIIPENLQVVFSNEQEHVKHHYNKQSSKFFIFDFTENNIGTYVEKHLGHPSILFKRPELFNLLGSNFGTRYRFPSSKIGGLILISDPSRFPFDKAYQFQNMEAGFFTYIKLGNYGQYLAEEMTILFAHFSSKGDKNFKIWGAAELTMVPTIKDITEEKIQLKESNVTDANTFTDAEVLWYNPIAELDFVDPSDFEDLNNMTGTFKPLWEKEDFSIHNSYNETNQVILFNLKNFQNLKELALPVSQILTDSVTLESLKNEVEEAYLSFDEVEIFKEEIKKMKEGGNSRKSSHSNLFTPNPQPLDDDV